MHTRSRAVPEAASTLAEVVFVVLVLAVVAALVLPHFARMREEPARIRCANNLHQLAKGMATYLEEHGDNRWYPCPLDRTIARGDDNGAEWLASLYWTGVVPDPGVFVCPSSPDTNEDGADIGSFMAAATFGSQTVSYAGMHYRSSRDALDRTTAEALPSDYPSNKPMASDDTQGDVNHGTLANGGMRVLFFDFHVEFMTGEDIDLRYAVGDTSPGALLRELRN